MTGPDDEGDATEVPPSEEVVAIRRARGWLAAPARAASAVTGALGAILSLPRAAASAVSQALHLFLGHHVERDPLSFLSGRTGRRCSCGKRWPAR